MSDGTEAVKPRVASLEDLKPAIVNVEVEREDGEIVLYPIRMPTYFELLDMESKTPPPEAPIIGAQKDGRPLRNFNDPGFLASWNKVLARRNVLTLAKCLQLDIPGGAIEEKADWLEQHIDARVMRQLAGIIDSVLRTGEARVETRANTFHGNGNSDT